METTTTTTTTLRHFAAILPAAIAADNVPTSTTRRDAIRAYHANRETMRETFIGDADHMAAWEGCKRARAALAATIPADMPRRGDAIADMLASPLLRG